MEDIQNLEDILLILQKQDEMLKMLEEQQDEIDNLEQQISELTQKLSDSREQTENEREAARHYRLEFHSAKKMLSQAEEELDESMSLNEDLTEENRRLTDLLTASESQNQKLQTQIDRLKNLQD